MARLSMNRVRNPLIINETLEPGSWSQYVSNFWKTFLSMNLSVAAIARVETGSLTPTLSQRERVSHIPHGDMPELQPSEPSRPVPANTRPNPSKHAGNILPLPPGEGRGEGRSLHSSLHGSWSQYVSNFWKTFLPTNRSSVAAGVPPAVEGGVSPPGISSGSWPVSRSFLNWGLPSIPFLLWLAIALLPLDALTQTAPSQTPFPAPIPSTTLHNLFRVSTHVFSGSSPEGDTAFAELGRLGITTIVSVDGARPDIETARRHGLRYIHLPIGYDGVTSNRTAQLAQAATTVEGPIYVHCHHGKHRGPAAAAILCLSKDTGFTDQAVEWLRRAGTAPDYPGLYRSVREFVRPGPDRLGATPPLPEISPTSTLVESMVAIDVHAEHLKSAQKAGWGSVPGHPDLEPRHEATQLWELLRELARDPTPSAATTDYRKRLTDSEEAAASLRSALTLIPSDPAQSDAAMKLLMNSCTACHKAHRNALK
jgi:protein tyrosine phosphatase (PTP) superfamily phosphohydrolase (DUF442 family)